MIIALDGLAGSGKGTVARLLAKEIGWPYLDIGLIFRFVAWYGDKFGKEALYKENGTIIYRDEVCELRSETYALKAAEEAARNFDELAEVARRLAKQWPNFVCDGRGAGTAIFEADFLFCLETSEVERASRRANQTGVSYKEALEAIGERDRRDYERDRHPFRIPVSAVVINTSLLSPDECVAKIRGIVET